MSFEVYSTQGLCLLPYHLLDSPPTPGRETLFFLLRCNSRDIKLNILKWRVEWHLVYSNVVQPPALSSSKTFSTPHNKALYPSKRLPTFFPPSRWRPLVRALPPRFTYSECSVYAAPCTTRPFASGFLRLASSQSSSLLRHVPVLYSFSWLSNSPLQEQATVC